jgi:hypothetical protein
VTEPSDCHLSVFVTPTQLTFSLYRRATSKYVLLAAYELEANEPHEALLNGFEPLTGQFETVSVALAYESATLVPTAIFSETQLDLYIQNTITPDTTHIKFDVADAVDMVVVYPSRADFEARLLKRFPQATLHHRYWFLLQNDFRAFKNSGDVLILSKVHQELTLLGIQKQQVVLCNSYICNNQEELLYFVMNAIEVLGFQPTTCKVIVRGELLNESAEIQLLKQYIAQIQLDTSPSEYRYSHEFSGIPDNQFTELFNQLTCVS